MLVTHPVQPYQGLQALFLFGVVALVRGAARGALKRARRRHGHVPETLRSRPLLRTVRRATSDSSTAVPRSRWLSRMLAATRPVTP